MMHWEYKTVQVDGTNVPDNLRDLGEQGWELVAAYAAEIPYPIGDQVGPLPSFTVGEARRLSVRALWVLKRPQQPS